MKKDIKKNDKKKVKEHIKKYSLLALNIICYICTALFVISLIVGACTPPKQSAKVDKPVSTMVLRDKPVYRAVQEPISENYYTSFNDISITSDFQLPLLGAYDNNYVHKNPTYFDIFNALYTDIFDGDIYYLKITGDVSYVVSGSTVHPTHLSIRRLGTGFYLGCVVLDNNVERYVQNFCVWNSNQQYVNIARPAIYTQVFNGSVKATYYASASNANKQFYKFMLFYYSTRSIRNFTLQLYDNPVKSIQSAISEYDSNNGYLFYNSQLYDYLTEHIDYPEYVYSYTLAIGGFQVNDTYYDSIHIIIRSAWSTSTNGRQVNQYWFGGVDENGILSSNDSLKGYFFIEAISLTGPTTTGVFPQNPGFVIYQVPKITAIFGASPGYKYSFSQSDFVNPNYQYLNVAYISHRTITSSYVDLINFSSFTTYKYFPFYSNLISRSVEPIIQDTGNPFVFNRVFDWLNLAFVGLMPILTFSILPGISIGAILLLPFVITLLLFVIKLFKR